MQVARKHTVFAGVTLCCRLIYIIERVALRWFDRTNTNKNAIFRLVFKYKTKCNVNVVCVEFKLNVNCCV